MMLGKKILKVEFENEALSKKFVNKDIDIFAGNYGYGCHGEKPIKRYVVMVVLL